MLTTILDAEDGTPEPPTEGAGTNVTLNLGPPAFLTTTQLCLWPPEFTTPDSFLITVSNAQPGHVYELQSKIALTNAAWLTEYTLHVPTNQTFTTVSVPATVATDTLYLRARDWTDVDEDQDSLPDWWEWEHFGMYTQSAHDDFDSDGADNLTEFNAGGDPNTLGFHVNFDHLHVSGNTVNASLTFLQGEPAWMACWVDEGTPVEPAWMPYQSAFNLDLGTNDGRQKIWIGLKGRAGSSSPT